LYFRSDLMATKVLWLGMVCCVLALTHNDFSFGPRIRSWSAFDLGPLVCAGGSRPSKSHAFLAVGCASREDFLSCGHFRSQVRASSIKLPTPIFVVSVDLKFIYFFWWVVWRCAVWKSTSFCKFAALVSGAATGL
jgi:hypothetical protein